MAGRTGKMTKAEIARAGPQLILFKFPNGKLKIVNHWEVIGVNGSILAKSYSRSYLKRIMKIDV